MATKAELEKELETVKADYLVLEKSSKVLVRSKADLEAKLQKVEEKLQKAEEKKSSKLPKDQKESLVKLTDFLFRLFRESEHPGVRQDIMDWRALLSELTSDE